jgi:hypothetical protein
LATPIDLAGRLLFSGEFQRTVGAQLDLRKFATALSAAGTPAACWEVIREAGPQFGFDSARLCLGGEVFECSSDDAGATAWTVRLPLSNGDYAVLSRRFASAVLPMAVAPFVDTPRQTLLEKFPEAAVSGASRPEVTLATD